MLSDGDTKQVYDLKNYLNQCKCMIAKIKFELRLIISNGFQADCRDDGCPVQRFNFIF